jgi:hypothetical protein
MRVFLAMNLALLLALPGLIAIGCGTVTADPHDAGGTGGAGGQLAAATGGQGGHDVAGAGGAAGAASSSTGGAAGESYPDCGQVSGVTVSATESPAHCLEGCTGGSSTQVDAGAAHLCLVAPAVAAEFTNAPGPIYCWQQGGIGNSVPPAACY